MAITKYITNKMLSSVVLTWIVKRGGIKKISQINALNVAASKTGKISKLIANKETVTNKMNAATLYPIHADKPKQMADTTMITALLNKYCRPLPILLNKNLFI